VNNRLDVNDSQETRLKNIKSTVKVAARDLKMKDAGIKKKHWFINKCQRTVMKSNEVRNKYFKTLLQNP